MEIFVAILIIALIAAVVFAVMQRKRPGARGLAHPRSSPIGRRHQGTAQRDPMAGAVAEHAQATDPHDAVAAEQRLQAQARQVAAGLQAEAHRSEHQRASDQLANPGAYAGDPRMDGGADPAGASGYADTNRYADPAPGAGYEDPAPGAAHGDPRLDNDVDPATGARRDGYGDPATDPRYNDPSHDGRPPADDVDPRYDDRNRRA